MPPRKRPTGPTGTFAGTTGGPGLASAWICELPAGGTRDERQHGAGLPARPDSVRRMVSPARSVPVVAGSDPVVLEVPAVAARPQLRRDFHGATSGFDQDVLSIPGAGKRHPRKRRRTGELAQAVAAPAQGAESGKGGRTDCRSDAPGPVSAARSSPVGTDVCHGLPSFRSLCDHASRHPSGRKLLPLCWQG